MAEQDRVKAHTASSATGGAGNPERDKAPQPTSKAPVPEGGAKGGAAPGSGASGVGSGLQGGGTKPTNERLVGEEAHLGSPDAASGRAKGG